MSRSISSHVARRTSPDRAAVSTRNSNARLVVTTAWEARTVARASATAPWGSPHVLDDGLLPPGGLPEGVARRVVRPVAHRDRPLHWPPRDTDAETGRLGVEMEPGTRVPARSASGMLPTGTSLNVPLAALTFTSRAHDSVR